MHCVNFSRFRACDVAFCNVVYFSEMHFRPFQTEEFTYVLRETYMEWSFTERSWKSNLSVSYVVSQGIKEATEARSKRRSTHVPNLTDELGTAEKRRLNQFGSAG